MLELLKPNFVTINGYKIHYLEAGTKEPVILLMHGTPTNAYIWRNVIPGLSNTARVIAIDMIGFGKSDKPVNIEYDIQSYCEYLKKFIEILNLKKIIIVGMDLGLIVGLSYAMANEEKIGGIVMFEGFIQPLEDTIKSFPVSAKILMQLSKSKKFAQKMFLKKGEKTVEQMISMLTIRKIPKEDMNEYIIPMKDEAVRRKVWLEGIGPHTILSKKVTDNVREYSKKLCKSQIPKLLLYAQPGSVINKKTIEYASKNISNLKVEFIGQGKHFLPEDQPENISNAIVRFYQNIT